MLGMHHLPFAEASMSHKHRKKRPEVAGEQDEEEQEQADVGVLESSSILEVEATDFLQQPPSLATEVHP